MAAAAEDVNVVLVVFAVRVISPGVLPAEAVTLGEIVPLALS